MERPNWVQEVQDHMDGCIERCRVIEKEAVKDRENTYARWILEGWVKPERSE